MLYHIKQDFPIKFVSDSFNLLDQKNSYSQNTEFGENLSVQLVNSGSVMQHVP